MLKSFRFLLLISCIFLFLQGIAQEKWIPLDLQSRIALAQKNRNHVMLAEYFLGKPYVANALSADNPEKLYISLEDFDCVTFIENVMSLYQSKGQDSLYKKNLIHWRYSQTKDIRFETRQHYFSSAMRQLTQDSWINPVHTSEDIQVNKSFRFLSQFYRSKGRNISIAELEQIERSLVTIPFNYIPSSKVSKVISNLKEGDIITFVSKRNDLDVQHTGFLTYRNSNWYLLHASQEIKKVCVSDKNLLEYLKSHPSFLGIQVFRPNFIK